GLRLWSLGDCGSPEGELVQRFFDGIEKYSPALVSWNGSAFDLPVLTYRALLAGVAAPRFWETGAEDPAFRYNNYLSRYHWRHTAELERVKTLLQDGNEPHLAEFLRAWEAA